MLDRLTELLQLTTALLAEKPGHEDDYIVERLIAAGAPKDLAERLLAFVPMAFARVFLSEDGGGPEHSTHCELRDLESGRSVRVKLTDEPAFVHATEIAATWSRSADRDRFVTIAERSAEVDAVRRLTRGGGRASDIVLTETVLLRVPLPPALPGKRWWRLW